MGNASSIGMEIRGLSPVGMDFRGPGGPNADPCSRPPSRLHKVFSEFLRHFKYLQPLELDFRAKFPNRPVRNHFFLGPTVFAAKSEKYICCKSLKYGYEHFGSKRMNNLKSARNAFESQTSSIGHPPSVRVKIGQIL